MSRTGLFGEALERRLHELLGEERNVQVEFLIHLEEFDRRRGWEASGHPTLWEYCRKELGLLDGAVFRRTTAMRILREFPQAEAFLRDGRLFMTTLVILRNVLTPENATRLFEDASGKPIAEVEYLAACIRPKEEPAVGIRKLPMRAPPPEASISTIITSEVSDKSEDAIVAGASVPAPSVPATQTPIQPEAPLAPLPPRRRAEMHPVSAERWAITLVVDAEFREVYEKAKAILGHVVPDGDPVRVVKRALEEIVRKEERRNTAKDARAAARETAAASPISEEKAAPVEGAREVSNGPGEEERRGSAGNVAMAQTRRPAIPAAIRREVMGRDGGRCCWPMAGRGACGSVRQLEIDHIVPHARGGKTEAANLRALCRDHNARHAREVFGEEFMRRFSKRSLPLENMSGNSSEAFDTAAPLALR